MGGIVGHSGGIGITSVGGGSSEAANIPGLGEVDASIDLTPASDDVAEEYGDDPQTATSTDSTGAGGDSGGMNKQAALAVGAAVAAGLALRGGGS